MLWLLLCLFVSAAASIELQCDPPHCAADGTRHIWKKYKVDGKPVMLNYKESYFYVSCEGWAALDSPEMPRFTTEFKVSSVEIFECPFPTTRNASLLNALAALNVKLQPNDGKITLKLKKFPLEPPLSPQSFIGLGDVTDLVIDSLYNDPRKPPAQSGFLAEFKNLRSLMIASTRLADGELSRLPRTLKKLDLETTSLLILPTTLGEVLLTTVQTLSDLTELSLNHGSWLEQPIETITRPRKTNADSPPSLVEVLELWYWVESFPAPLEHCESLRVFKSQSPTIRRLPERFIADCPRLEDLTIKKAKALRQLPEKLLEGASALKRLSFQSCQLESIPEGVLRDAPNLVELDLSSNAIQTLSSDVFLGVSLRSLTLSSNSLDNAALRVVGTLTSLTDLDLAGCSSDYCNENGYSQLRNLTQLKKLNVFSRFLKEICRDWREDLTHLELLYLAPDQIHLKANDFYYKRDASVNNSIVKIGDWSSVSVDFTETDYKNALSAPATGATLQFWNFSTDSHGYWKTTCDCSLYWLRRALDDASHAVKITDLACNNNNKARSLKALTPAELCPELEPTKQP